MDRNEIAKTVTEVARENYLDDYNDLMELRRLIHDGSKKAALEALWDLDTEVRDTLPDEVWEYLDEDAD